MLKPNSAYANCVCLLGEVPPDLLAGFMRILRGGRGRKRGEEEKREEEDRVPMQLIFGCAIFYAAEMINLREVEMTAKLQNAHLVN